MRHFYLLEFCARTEVFMPRRTARQITFSLLIHFSEEKERTMISIEREDNANYTTTANKDAKNWP